jgi:hypothetical protein
MLRPLPHSAVQSARAPLPEAEPFVHQERDGHLEGDRRPDRFLRDELRQPLLMR